jgi:XRE family transcriptional regulator, stress-response regulator
MVLLRHLLGDALRRLRLRQGRTLREVSAAARVSLGYLSEVERGQKEASSELLAAICSALGTPLSQVFREVSDNFALAELQSEPVLAGAREPVLEASAAAGRPAVGIGTSRAADAPRAFTGTGRPEVRLAAGRELGAGPGRVLGPVQLPPGQTAAFDDEVARRIRDVTDMVPV